MRSVMWAVIPCLLASSIASAKPRRGKRVKPKPVVVEEPVEEASIEDVAAAEPEEDLAVEEVIEKPRKKTKRRSETEIYFRAGIAHVEPRIASSGLQLEPVGIIKLATPTEPVAGGIETDPTNIFAAIIGVAPSWFDGYIAIETIIGVPKKAKLRAKGDLANKSLAPTALDLVPTGVPPLGEELGEASAVPPMVTVVLRTPKLGPVRAYVGAGASVLFVRDAKITNKVLTEVATPKLEIDPAFGFVAQAGIDVQIYKRFYARLDVKEMWFEKSESRISNIHVRTQIPFLETVDVGSARSEVQANPIIVQFGIGARF